MKIMEIVTRSDLGGAQSVVINLSNRLCKSHEVVVVAGAEGGNKMGEMLDDSVLQESVKWLGRSVCPWKDILALLFLRRLYHKHHPDVIHLHSSKAGLLGRIVFPKSKVIYTIHGFDSIRIAYRKFLVLEQFLQNRCRALVGVCRYDKENLLREGIIHQVKYVYNGIERVEVDNDLSLPDECLSYKKVVLCIARLSKQKKFDLFLEIADLLPQYAFIWVGNQEEVNVHSHRNVYCLGSVSDAGRYNNLVDLFILPTNYEGLPMVILEAMSFGKPIVASKVGGISEIVVDDINGYTVENKAEIFADKISYILEHADIYKSFSDNALKRFNEDLTVEKMVEGYLRIYQQ